MSEAIKPTPGPWHTSEVAKGLVVYDELGWAVADAKVFHSRRLPTEAQCNARLIAEAGTVHHGTGMSPKQLVERVKELEEALRACAAVCAGETMSKSGIVSALEKARAAISKSLPNTVAEVQ